MDWSPESLYNKAKVFAARAHDESVESALFGFWMSLDWSPFLRQTVKTHFSLNGELSHGIVTQAVHAGV